MPPKIYFSSRRHCNHKPHTNKLPIFWPYILRTQNETNMSDNDEHERRFRAWFESIQPANGDANNDDSEDDEDDDEDPDDDEDDDDSDEDDDEDEDEDEDDEDDMGRDFAFGELMAQTMRMGVAMDQRRNNRMNGVDSDDEDEDDEEGAFDFLAQAMHMEYAMHQRRLATEARLNDNTNDEDWYADYDEETRRDFRYGALMAEQMMDEREMGRQAELRELCAKISRNDPSVTQVKLLDTKGYAARLGHALMANTNVQELELNLYRVDVVADDANGNDHQLENLVPLLDYLRYGSNFRTLDLHGGLPVYINRCIDALSLSRTLSNLLLGTGDIPPRELAHLLRTTQSLRVLALLMINSEVLAQAFGDNDTLHILSLTVDADYTPRHDGAILRNLYHHPQLHQLILYQHQNDAGGRNHSFVRPVCPRSVTEALADFLRHTVLLTELVLNKLVLDGEHMRDVIQGLQANQSLQELTLSGCTIQMGAMTVLRDTVEGGPNSNGHPYTPISSSIHKLTLDEHENGTNYVQTIPLLILGCHDLQTFEWKGRPFSMAAATVFWGTIETASAAAANTRKKVSELRLGTFKRDGSMDAMSKCLPKLVSLQELYFDGIDHDSVDAALLKRLAGTIKQSGSLLEVSFSEDDEEDETSIWNERDSRMIEAVFERNRLLPKLVAKPATAAALAGGLVNEQGESEGNGELKDDENESADDEDESVDDEELLEPTKVTMFPKLFCSATDAPYLSHTWVLSGVLALNDELHDDDNE